MKKLKWFLIYKKRIVITILYLPSAVFIALMPVGPNKCLKQIIQIELNRVKNPNWREANQLFTSMAENLNSGLLRTNPASGQGGT